jgi:hypothetical protein
MCDHCDKAFSLKANLGCHVNTVHLKKKYFKCDHCDKAFSLKHHFVDHVNRIHKMIKSYSCELCSYTSYANNDLKRHPMKMHSQKTAHRHGLEDLMKEAKKDKMIVSVEKITVFE